MLLVHAVRRSRQLGKAGRIVLHSLEDPETLAFYRDVIVSDDDAHDALQPAVMRHERIGLTVWRGEFVTHEVAQPLPLSIECSLSPQLRFPLLFMLAEVGFIRGHDLN